VPSDLQATIAAIASNPQGAARGLVRISGPSLLEQIQPWVQLPAPLPRSATRIAYPLQLPSPLGSLPADLWLWPNSLSYTGQPTLEIHTIGSPPLLQEILKQLGDLGIRQALPGEFTLRAFLAGRLDLAQCEAVLAVIHAQSQKELDRALRQLAGGIQVPIHTLRIQTIELLADIEAGLDFVDEDISFVSHQQIEERLVSLSQQLDQIQKQWTTRLLLTSTPRIVLAGLPNAGKSSLFNALLQTAIHQPQPDGSPNRLAQQPSALVSPQAGTTRDYLEATIQHLGIEMAWVDTAGIESLPADQSPRAAAQLQTNSQLTDAHLILLCHPADSPPESLPALPESLHSIPCWHVATCFDLAPTSKAIGDRSDTWVTSAKTGQGIQALLDAVAHWILQQREETPEMIPATAARCQQALQRASESVEMARQSNRDRLGDEWTAGHLRHALDDLGQIAGEVCTDDILDALFSRFCIGK
jgi:tRNA modification GTPase